MPPAPGSPRLLVTLALCLSSVVACKPDATPTEEQQELVMAFGGDRGQACQYVSSLSKPYVVAWDEIKLNDLQRAIDKGQPLAVRYEGCSLELLTGCNARDGHYQFSPATMTKPQVVALRSATEAIAEFQIGGVGLEAHFDRYDELEVMRARLGSIRAQFEVNPWRSNAHAEPRRPCSRCASLPKMRGSQLYRL